MKDLFSFAQLASYGQIICPVCDEKFVDNNLGVSKNAVSIPVCDGTRTLRETCGDCGDWNGQDIEDIRPVNFFGL
jgi:hypothetical protein